MNQKVLVLGASLNPARYSYTAISMLTEYDHQVFAHGLRAGEVKGVSISTELPEIEDLDTITLYLGPKNQPGFYEYIIAAKPKRVIFNPGTENPELMDKLNSAEISYETACTLVLLRTNQFSL